MATAVAVLGFRYLVCEVQAALSRQDEATTLLTIGAAYLRFALNEPHLFRLMYSGDEIDPMDPDLMAASVPLLTLTADAAGAAGPDSDATVLSWAIVHGLATLVLDSQLEGLIPADRDAKWQRLMAVLNLALPMFDPARRPPV
ncbi:MAG: TetR-like C-terminal domain-containing protein [Labrys sp. (in: a-proteobacteria)]